MSTEALLEAVASRLFLDRQLEFWLRELDPTLARRELRARITGIVVETSDTKTFVLKPSRQWAGFTAGQYVTIDVEIDGVRTRRCYSISSAVDAGRSFTITVKRAKGGRVSSWLHDQAKVGDVVTIGTAAGDFVLPVPLPAKLLLVSGGSGITPIFSLLLELAGRGRLDDVVLLHYARTREDVIFREHLAALADRHCGLRLELRYTRGGGTEPRFDEQALRRIVPDFADRHAFVCGPPALMEEVERLWERHGLTDRLRRERFVAPTAAIGEGATDARVTLVRSGKAFRTDGKGTLLEQAERAGAKPAYGCRMGICHTCKCRKQSGTVQNVRTGEISSEPDEDIQLCISVARSDIELSL
jgi:ferredoxin-NADP reductase